MAAATQLERDAVALDPKHYAVETEDDEIRIVRIRYAPGEKSVMHQHRRGVGVFLTDGDFTFTYPDGTSERISAKRGDFLKFDEAWEHLPESLADGPFEAIYIELKR
jgi:quercetin dioxygenase-like cupin family protein